MSASPLDAAAHVFVDDLDAPSLDPADRHHLERVRRLRHGDVVTVADGRGRWRWAVLDAELGDLGPVQHEPAPEPRVSIAFAPVKGDRTEWAVQKLTEVGVDRIVVLATERGVVRWEGERADHHLARLRRIAREAAMQSRRVRLPELLGPTALPDVARWPGACLAELGGERVTLDRHTVLVGPEGGWSPEERSFDLPTVGLGAHVLRAETAAVVAGSLLCAMRGGVV